jgi:hypothetical protein
MADAGTVLMTIALMALSMVASFAAGQAPVDPALVAQADALEKRWADQYLKYDDAKEIARLDQAVDTLLPQLGADGRFADLTYAPQITGRDGGPGWGDHLLRTVDLFTAWRLPGTKRHGDTDLARKAALALETYLDAPYNRADTWGFGHPYADLLENNRIGRCALFARSDPKQFAQADVERWANHITERAVLPVFERSDDPARQFTKPAPYLEGGANLLWAARGELVPYLVTSNQALRLRAIDQYMGHVWSSQRVRSPKGVMGQIERLTVDGMLGEHLAPAMGSYGEWYINAVVEYRDLIQGVERWQMPADLNAFWLDVLIDSVAHCYQGAVDPNLGNPLVWLNARRDDNAKLKAWVNAFSGSTDHRAADVKALLDWSPGKTPWPFAERSTKYYYTADFMTKHYPLWMASVRAVSERTYGMETFGQKEKRWAIESVMLPLGTVLLRRDTREFQDIATGGAFTAMDFARWPGQTTRHVSPEQLRAVWNIDRDGYYVRMVFGGTPFSGGVTTAHTGVMGFWQSRYVHIDRDRVGEHKISDIGTSGRRAVFFLEDAIVHLGTRFDLRHAEPTLTNIEQRASGAETTTFAIGDDVRTLKRGEVVRDAKLAWAWHEGVGYLPPADGEKTLQDIQQPGTPAQQMFSLWSDHGNDKASLQFDWAVLPGVPAEDMPRLSKERPWRIVSNGGQQAIEVPAKNWLGAVFHEAGEVEALGTTVHASRACVLIVERTGDRATITLADPFQTDDEVTVRVGTGEAKLKFPGAPHRGASVTIDVNVR